MIKMTQATGKVIGKLQDTWLTNCPYCTEEVDWVCISPVYCPQCKKELPPWYLLLEDDLSDQICMRVEYHFSGDL